MSSRQSEAVILNATKPWKLDLNQITPGDAKAVKSWSTQLINYTRSVDRKSHFDFAKSEWSWKPAVSNVTAYNEFKHPSSIAELQACKDTTRFPFFIREENNPYQSGANLKLEAEKENNTFIHTSYMVNRTSKAKITNGEEAMEALIKTAEGYTNCRSTAVNALKAYKINISNCHAIFEDFLVDFETNLKICASTIDMYLPDAYESSLANGVWRNYDQMVTMFYADIGVDLTAESGPAKPVDFLTYWEMFGSNDFSKSRTQITMRVLQNNLRQLCTAYDSSNTVNTDEFSEEANFEGEDNVGPIANFLMFASCTNDIPFGDKKNILADMATRGLGLHHAIGRVK